MAPQLTPLKRTTNNGLKLDRFNLSNLSALRALIRREGPENPNVFLAQRLNSNRGAVGKQTQATRRRREGCTERLAINFTGFACVSAIAFLLVGRLRLSVLCTMRSFGMG